MSARREATQCERWNVLVTEIAELCCKLMLMTFRLWLANQDNGLTPANASYGLRTFRK
jgi:hypothetical protein